MNETVKLGSVIEGKAHRDAIHIAVAPVVADEQLSPGQHVGLVQGNRVGPGGKHLGIVDPFLTAPVLEGQQFYLCLYPLTVTGLRHEWTHPAFESLVAAKKERRERSADEFGIAADFLEDGGFDGPAVANLRRESFFRSNPSAAWLQEFAAEFDADFSRKLTYEELVEAARRFAAAGETTCLGSDLPYENGHKIPEMWEHLKAAEGIEPPADTATYIFHCAC